MTEREKELAMMMANANAPKDPIEELRETIQYEKDELRKQVQKSWTILGMALVIVLIAGIMVVAWIWKSPEKSSSFHATHFERAVLADYNGKKTVYLINGNDTTRMEVK